MRSALIEAIWKQPVLPAATSVVTESVVSPIGGVDSLLRCDRLTHDMGGGEVNHGYLHRTSAIPKSRLVVAIQGHTDVYDNLGVGDVVRSLVPRGFDVLVLGMPGKCSNGGLADHNQYAALETPTLCPLRYFVEPGITALNLLAASYSDVTVLGISGGGWTATALAALDQRIRLSIPVAGTLPWYLRTGGSLGDWEQSRLDSLQDYTAQYLLACDADGRRQVQVLNRYDSAAFSQAGFNGAYGAGYAAIITNWTSPQAAALGGSFALVEDLSHTSHLISPWCLANVILPELGESAPVDIVLDDGLPGHTITGAWSYWTSAGVGADLATAADYLTAPAGTGECRSRWALSVPAGSYLVSADWIGHANRAPTAKYRIYDGTTLLAEVIRDQRGLMQLYWSNLGTFVVVSGTLVVELTNESAGGYIVADAVRVQGVQ